MIMLRISILSNPVLREDGVSVSIMMTINYLLKTTNYLHYSRFLESLIRTVFIDSFQCSSRKRDSDRLFELRNINTLLLKICVFSDFPSWVKLGSTSSVAVSSTHE